MPSARTKPAKPPYFVEQTPYTEGTSRIFAVDDAMQVQYAKNLDALQNNLYPVIVGVFTDHGGQLELHRDPQYVEIVQPTPLLFKKIKSFSHIPLAVYKIVAPYLGNPAANRLWQPDMLAFKEKVAAILPVIDQADLPDDVLERSRQICTLSLAFMDSALEGGFEVEDVLRYGSAVRPLIEGHLMAAARLQVDALIGVMERWRDELGPELWGRVYAVACTSWVMAGKNVFFQVFSKVIGKEEENQRIILAEGINSSEEAFPLLARIVSDRGASQVIFADSDVLNIAILGPDAEIVLAGMGGCPHGAHALAAL